MKDLRHIANALGGEVSSGHVLAPGPGHSPGDRSLSVKIDPNAPDGFVVHSFADDDPIACKDYVRGKLGLEGFKPNGGSGRRRRADRKSTRLNSSHLVISYAVFCLKKKKNKKEHLLLKKKKKQKKNNNNANNIK